jgi:diguanylate cyclase (GGDEF)-like protein
MSNEVTQILGNCAQLSSIGFAVITEDGVVACANSAFCEMLAISAPESIVGRSLVEYVVSHFHSTIADLSQALKCPDAANVQLRLERDSEPLALQIASVDSGLRMLVAAQLPKPAVDSTALNTFSHRDPLTGIGNRMCLNDVITHWHPRGPDALSLAVIMIDLDRFKKVNDALGQGAGDTLLKLVAKRIQSATRDDDTVVRMGGDEFVVLHTIGLQPIGAESVAKRIVELMSRPFLIDGKQVNIGASVGIAALNFGTDNITDLLKHAEFALYEAKAAGRGTVRFFEPALALQAMERHNLEVDLRRALGLKEFILMYQPQVNMTDGALQGFEALIRWQNPARGLVSPVDFILLAEETGEIHAIGEWTLRTACKEAMSWDGNFSVAVNVSPIQFENERIVDIVRNVLASTRLPPERLELEITEGVLMKDFDNALKQLWEIKSLGVGIAMDDFGTGYSSLSYLNSFPFSKIKIDQSFVRGENSPKSRALVQAIISLGASLSIMTIAEGVETKEQYDQLATDGCLAAQGYLISRPIPTMAIADFIFNLRNKTTLIGNKNE